MVRAKRGSRICGIATSNCPAREPNVLSCIISTDPNMPLLLPPQDAFNQA
jgi:hypothetical protein